MPTIRMNTTEEDVKKMEELLPKEPLTESILLPALKKHMHRYLLQALRAEIEIYKAFPKRNNRFDEMTFNPKNNETCFMGQGFMANAEGGDLMTGYKSWYDADLVLYRDKIGKINHKEWGNCTLLEIWAADHFDKYPSMVKGVHAYCFGTRVKLPRLYFRISPFLYTKESGTAIVSEKQKEKAEAKQAELDDLILGGLRARHRAENRRDNANRKNRNKR